MIKYYFLYSFSFFLLTVYLGDRIASFFLDPNYSRPAEKRGGAWMDQCLGNAILYISVHIK